MSTTTRRFVHSLALAVALAAAACSGAFRAPPPASQAPDPSTWSQRDLTVAYLGHASVLIDFGGTLLITDPTLYHRIGLAVGPITFGPKRVVASALGAAQIPPLDAVLVSHAHMDSLDRRSLARLAATPLLVVPERTADLVDDLGYARVVELPWGQRTTAGGVSIEGVEVKHWGRRWPWESWRGYDGYLLRRGSTGVLFAGDTAYSPGLAELARQRGVKVVILGIGAYDPWVWNHQTPEQAWQTFAASGAEYLVPVHWDTFRLGKEPIGDSMRRLLAAAGAGADRVVVREIGATWKLRLLD
ncbi:MAG: MBL fold metallo-hydrolase [Deltaproteobacteria bacterium]|nr:MBL fold metallo-hydrolase [Deltaproteobacteria bacterium]